MSRRACPASCTCANVLVNYQNRIREIGLVQFRREADKWRSVRFSTLPAPNIHLQVLLRVHLIDEAVVIYVRIINHVRPGTT